MAAGCGRPGAYGLKGIEARYHARNLDERRDINGDLVEGFLSALPRINVARPHIGRRLLDAAKRQLRKGRAVR
ncbi:hypothetical protein [Salinispora arenicola]|uniref:hypothetical protein n=1 Tax=Salinispora arenicola TaxID=168697 RepID=UPI000369456F|nr:hypothetical protein [Salinispora arenicola]